MTSLANKLQNLELCLKNQHGPKLWILYGQALIKTIVLEDHLMELEILKSLGDLHLKKGKLSKDSAEFDKAAALYAAALLRCTDPDMGQTLEHRIGYMEKLSRQLLQGYTPQYRQLSSPHYTTNNVLRVAGICQKLDRRVGKPGQSIEAIYTKTLISAIANKDTLLELEVLKSLGDLYLEKGRKRCHLSQFSKAAAMYGKALTRCEDPETKLTLKHRVLYIVKIWGAVRKQLSHRRQRGKRLDMVHQSRYNTRPAAVHIQPLHPDIQRKTTEPGIISVAKTTLEEDTLTDSQYQDHLREGDSSLSRADLDSAEQHFAAALRTVHVRDPTAQQYQREVEPLCKLGDVYSKRGQQTGDGGDFVKAAALYNAAIARSNDEVLIGNIVTAIKEVERSFLKCILVINSNISQDNAEKHKKQLKEMRDQIKLEMETIDQQLDPYVHDEDDPCVKEIEAKRAQAVRHLFENIAQQRKKFISLLVEECIGVMGPPPCKYALIGLGSQATGLVTPYSDLEFAILVEEEIEPCLVYFRNLTHYLHLKVVNLGETILPALGIKSLNDFYSENPLDSWYYDSVTPRGFAFDGSMPKASKTPLGRQGTKDEQPSELICTPSNMISILQNDVTLYLKEGYHLATILRNPCLIAGDQDLIDTYMATTVRILQADGGKMARQLVQETLKELNIKGYSSKQSITALARLTDVKKDLYRFPAVAVDCLALSSGITPSTVWKTIEQMKKQQAISSNNAHHLTVLTSISAELRLRTYIANGGQKENLSALASMETTLNQQKPSLQTDDEMRRSIYGESTAHPEIARTLNSLGTACLYLPSEQRNAVTYLEQALEMCRSIYGQGTANPEIASILNNLGGAWNNLGDHRKEMSYYKQALQMHRNVYGQNTAHPHVAFSLNNVGAALQELGDNETAMRYLKQGLEMRRSMYGQSTKHPDIAQSLNNLGLRWFSLGDYRKAISYLEQALQMKRIIFGQSTPHPDIAGTLNNLGNSWFKFGDHRKAIEYHGEALQISRRIYGQSTAHPTIADSLSKLGRDWFSVGEYRKAISYFDEALQMYRSIYGQSSSHVEIIDILSIFGMSWYELDNHREAIKYLDEALQMCKGCDQSTSDLDIVTLLNNLGMAWYHLGEHRKAINYYEQVLQMKRSSSSESTSQVKTATALNNLGMAWFDLGDHMKAIQYHGEALQMFKSIYGDSTPHPGIVQSLHSLGQAWYSVGDHRKSIKFWEQELQMRRSIHGQSTPHPDIATTLNNLGIAWHKMGNHKKAVKYQEEALQMHKSVHVYREKQATNPDKITAVESHTSRLYVTAYLDFKNRNMTRH
ncbi:TTC28 [Branchiostoma lanceolatum]|uniref:TTC28 protein n=1 Tax=Branchiostoma lanceolatum TaxID=7740 RepID=A0A8J9VGD0_BRALA|nr:TTC28 [Branchiostoma lanceolatum]